MTSLAILLGLAAIVILLILDDREKDENGMPVREADLIEDWSSWEDWDWPADEPDWRWPR